MGQPTAYVIRLYHSRQVFLMVEKQFLNQDHLKIHESEVKLCHMMDIFLSLLRSNFFKKIIYYIFLQYLQKSFELF